jgi:hypothetical protein
MVIKGGSISGAARFAAHLQRTDTNEIRNDVIEMRDVAATDLRGAFREMEAVATGCPNCKKPLYQASINTQAKERMTDEQRMQSVDRLEKELGLTGQPRVVVVHEKNDGREHCHVVWSRIDLDKMRTISDSHNFRKHEIVARELEREFGHDRVQGAHIERDGQPRPPRTPGHKEIQQGARTGVSPKEATAHLTAAWQRADNGKAFDKALAESGWLLARGDRRDFVGIDPKGGIHSLARRIEGATAKDVKARFADLDLSRLPSVAEARAAQRAHEPTKLSARTVARQKEVSAHLSGIWKGTGDGQAFVAALEDKGWMLARGDYKNFVAIDPKGYAHSLSRRIEGVAPKDIRARFADLDVNQLPSVAVGQAAQRTRYAQELGIRRQAQRSARAIERGVPTRSPLAPMGREAEGAARAAGGTVKAAGKILDGLATAFEGLLGGGSSPRPRDAAKEGREQPDDNRRPLDAGPVPPPEVRVEAVKREEEQKSTRRQELLRDYGREVTPETEQDAKIERDQRNRGGGRERER